MNLKTVVALLLLSLVAPAQERESVQARTIFHPRHFLYPHVEDKGWFLVGWSITNFMTKTPDNTNLFLGVGYASKKWALENMIQRQWSRSGIPGRPDNSIWLDWRLFASLHDRVSLYLEGAPRLDKKMFYEFANVDIRVAGPFNLGIETENVHKTGKDVIGVGPRVAIPLPWKIAKVKAAVAVSRQFRTNGPNVTRLYAIFHWTF